MQEIETILHEIGGGYWESVGVSFEGRFKVWLDVLGLVKFTAGDEEGGVVAVVKAMFKGESGVGKQEELDQGRLVDKGASLKSLIRVQNVYYWPW